MADDLWYKPGSYYRIDDRSGFKVRVERTRQEWTGLIVDEAIWEERQPQDFVRGVNDPQTVPKPRPRQPDTFDGPIWFTINSDVAPQGTSATLETVAGMQSGDSIGIILDSGEMFNSVLTGDPVGLVITWLNPLPSSASSGNLLYDYTL